MISNIFCLATGSCWCRRETTLHEITTALDSTWWISVRLYWNDWHRSNANTFLDFQSKYNFKSLAFLSLVARFNVVSPTFVCMNECILSWFSLFCSAFRSTGNNNSKAGSLSSDDQSTCTSKRALVRTKCNEGLETMGDVESPTIKQRQSYIE